MAPSKSIFFSVVMRVLVIIFCIFFSFIRYASSERFDDIPPLIKAVGDIDVKKVQELIAGGANLNVTDSEGNTGLHYGIQNGEVPDSITIIMLLVLNHANVRARNLGGQTPLNLVNFIKGEGARMEVLGALIKNGANINAKDKKNYTLLARLVQQRDQAAIELLIDRWGSLLTRDTVEQAKKKAGLSDPAAKQDAAYGFDFTEIYDVLNKDIKVLGADGDITTYDKNGLNGLMLAVIRGDKKMVLDFLRRGASINAQSRDQFGYAPVHLAVLQENTAMLKTLLKKKANSNLKSKTGNAPLHLVPYISTNIQQQEAAKLLLNHEANINLRNDAGDTILHIAVKINNMSLLKFLIDRFGTLIKLDVRNNDGETPLDLAKKLDRNEMVKLLRKLRET